MKKFSAPGLALVTALSLVACVPAATTEASAPVKPGTVVEVAVANGNLKTLVAAVKAAGLVDTLNSARPFTVFVPTDAAFAKLPAGTVDTLLKPENKATLVKILTYHMVSGKVETATVVTMNGKKAATVAMQGVTVNALGGISNVTATDVQASNGVAHVIDTVLMPKQRPRSADTEMPASLRLMRVDTNSVHFRNIQKDAGCSSNSRNPCWAVLVPLGKIP